MKNNNYMRSKSINVLIILVSVLLISNISLVAQKSVELKYNLEEGDTYEFMTDLNQDISFDAGGTTMTLEQVMSFKMTSVVEGIEDNIIDKSILFNSIKMNQKIFGMEINYDSEDSATWTGMTADVAKEMNKIIGKTAKIIMDNKGNIQEMDVSELTENDELTNNLTSGNTYAVYPADKVSIGDSWETDINPLKDNDMKVHMKYTLLKANRKQAVIGLEGNLSGNEINGEQINLEGTTVGEMTVNVKTGMLITSTLDIELALDVEQQGVKIPANIISTTTTTATKIK